MRETRPTANPSRPNRLATARPRFGPAPTITTDMPTASCSRGECGQWRVTVKPARLPAGGAEVPSDSVKLTARSAPGARGRPWPHSVP